MIDFQTIFHSGFLVDDLDAAMDLYGRSLGLTWATPFTFDALPLWTPERGLHTVSNRVTYSIEGPQHLEIQVGDPGSFYDPAIHTGDHVGLWVEDTTAEVAALQADGWTVVAAGAPPEDGYGSFVYLRHGRVKMMVELVSTGLQPMFERWWSGTGTLGG